MDLQIVYVIKGAVLSRSALFCSGLSVPVLFAVGDNEKCCVLNDLVYGWKKFRLLSV